MTTFRVPVTFALDRLQKEAAKGAINLRILGHQECNVYDAHGNLVDHPDMTPEMGERLSEAHRCVGHTHQETLLVELDEETGGMHVKSISGPGAPDLDDFIAAVGGEGPLATQWADEPHRLVYDLVARLRG